MDSSDKRLGPFGYLTLYLFTWGGAVVYLRQAGADWAFPLISLGVFGLGLSLLTLVLTHWSNPPPVIVKRPVVETGAVLAFLVVYAFGFLGWAMQALEAAMPPGQGQEVAILVVKLIAHVVVPAILLVALGAHLEPLLETHLDRRGFWLTLGVLGIALVGLLAVVSPSVHEIQDLKPRWSTLAWAAPIAFVWMALEAGLTEEFLFRAVLQTRLAALLKSEWGALLIGAVLFALAHFPGLYFRGDPGVDGYSTDPLQVIAFTIATLSPLAILFGTIWSRTRSLLLCVLLHAAVDVIPALPGFLRIWAPQ